MSYWLSHMTPKLAVFSNLPFYTILCSYVPLHLYRCFLGLKKFFPLLFVLYPQFTSTTPINGPINYSMCTHTSIRFTILLYPNCSFWPRKWQKLVGKHYSSNPEHYQWERNLLWGATALGGTNLPSVINCVGNEKPLVGCPVALEGKESNWWIGGNVGYTWPSFLN